MISIKFVFKNSSLSFKKYGVLIYLIKNNNQRKFKILSIRNEEPKGNSILFITIKLPVHIPIHSNIPRMASTYSVRYQIVRPQGLSLISGITSPCLK